MRHIPLILLLLVLGAVAPAAQAQTATDRQQILTTLKKQADNWNAGRITEFMRAYWPSDSLTFVGKAGITYGYEGTLANYRRRYPDRASMGTLRFSNLKLDFPAKNLAYVIGKWQLIRPKVGNDAGHFTLLWKKSKGRWLIVSDHSS